MQSTVMKYAQVLSNILKVDVEIVDNRLNRIAGTGMFNTRININMSEEGYVYRTVIQTGEKKIIKNPGMHEICMHCSKRYHCEETFEMSAPIKMGDDVIGVIGFVCFNDNQKNHILKNLDTFLEFLDQISDLIASKAMEEIEKEKTMTIIDLLNSIISKVEKGIVIIDDQNRIIKMNSFGKKILNLNKTDSNSYSYVELKFTGNYIFGQKEFELKLNDCSHMLLGNEYIIYLNNRRYNKILIFDDINLLKEKIMTVSSTRENLGLDKIVGESQEIKIIKKQVKKIASSSSTVLIMGETGTGKELLARAIHMESSRVNGPFIAINCAAIPGTLLESELFGYVKGAFTGADPRGKMGKIELANKGTLFLDEIGEMPLYMQSKLLRVLEQKEVTRLGSNTPVSVDVRFIAATNRDLEKMIKENSFREDLYYRLNVIPLEVPPLRARKDDIKILTNFFIEKYSKLFNKEIYEIEDELWDYMYKYDWPGNVRELENTVEYMINMLGSDGIISKKLLPQKILKNFLQNDKEISSLQKMEMELIKKALKIYGNSVESKKVIASKLGIGIATLYRKIKKYKLE